jgi:hypothetical protein
MASAIFIGCALLCLACAVLLLRGYRRGGARLLLWSGCCFLGQALHNALLYVDVYIVPQTDLSTLRLVPACVGVALLIYGLIWDEG